MSDIPAEAKLLAGLIGSYASWKFVDGRYHLSYDVSIARRLLPAISEQKQCFATAGWNTVDMWYKTLTTKVHRNKTALISADTGVTYTYQQLEDQSNQVANWASSVPEWPPGTCVAMYMENDPLYMVLWLGLSKAGLEVALLNNTIKQKSLVHSVKIASCKGVIYSSDIGQHVADVEGPLRDIGVAVFAAVGAPLVASHANVLGSLKAQPVAACAKERRAHVAGAGSTFGYIYTSGTTGLPKACKISHAKMYSYAVVGLVFDIRPTDIIYGSGLPMYHTAANLGVTQVLQHGATYVIRKRFTASGHWTDCVRYKATVMQYIGELCRYLLAAPEHADMKRHRVRMAMGNGLRPEIWDKFQRRHAVPEIGEFYGATEGNAFLFNLCRNYEGQGAVGRGGLLINLARPAYIVKFDVDSEVPVRGKDGHCIVVADNEAGELITPIKVFKTPAGDLPDFEGYTNKEATESKILHNVFKKGDSFFRSGDLLRRDKGFTYFVDRIGDTFRWKGENVSTMEVSEVVSTFPGVVEASVYGVEVAGKDGRACMAAITMAEGQKLDVAGFAAYCQKNLPSYSVPHFLRFITTMDSTGTFKHMKVAYKKQGFDPSQCPDALMYYDAKNTTYKPIDEAAYRMLNSGIKGGQAKL
ncbi:Fatty acid transporter protein [Diplonema papillatum]|nr:Fatty acid transporter protein [Diplonema papillatum]